MKALEGLTVLDLSKLLPGNYCTMLLADYGANVIKVEKPDAKDPVRDFSPRKKDLSYWHLALNRNKKSLCIDFSSEDGKRVFMQLVKKADVLVESARVGYMAKLGLDYDSLKKINPKLIYCSISAVGQTNKNSGIVLHDLNVQGFLGLNGCTNCKQPTTPNVPTTGIIAAHQAVIAILAVVNARSTTGLGQYIDVSLMRSAMSLLPVDFSNHIGFLETGEPVYPRNAPNYTVYQTKDGEFISVGTFEKKFWQRLCEVLDISELSEYINDKNNFGFLKEKLQSCFKQKTKAEWEDIFSGENICVTPVYSLAQAYDEGMFDEYQMQLTLTDKTIGDYKMLDNAAILSDTPSSVYMRSTYLGENSEEILLDAGFDKIFIDDLIAKKIVFKS